MSPLPDPRVPRGSSYNQGTVIETVSNFYKLLSTLPYVDPKHILSAPTGGWPNISHDVVVGVFHKTEAVLELLRHLPYLDQDRGHSNKYVIGPDVEPCDYRQVLIADGTSETTKAMLAPSSVVDFPAWCVPLATAKSRSGRHVILDTSDGTITEYDPEGAAYDHDYADDDPRAWRNVCRWAEDPTDRTVTVTAYFERLEKRFRDLEWIGFWRMNEMPNLWMGYDFTWPNEEKETKELRDIILARGWPGRFNREECREALVAWEDASKTAG